MANVYCKNSWEKVLFLITKEGYNDFTNDKTNTFLIFCAIYLTPHYCLTGSFGLLLSKFRFLK